MKIKTISIIGGGSSGWMTAAALSKLCPHVDITLVESPTIKTIGVGESTLGHITKFLDLLDLKDNEWMKHCNATYKNGIRFTNFADENSGSFYYPFSLGFDTTYAPNGLLTWPELATVFPKIFTPNTFAEFYAGSNTFLCKFNKQTNNARGLLPHYNFHWDTAYHVDASLFGKFLKDSIALPNGVKHIFGNVENMSKDNYGNLEHLCLDSGIIITSDLFIDCTGFSSLLLENFMQQKFISFDEYLLNDRAWACKINYDDPDQEMHNYTDCTAIENGWVWHIPLYNRIGTGYVYSSKFVDDTDALQEFKKHLYTTGSKERVDNTDFSNISIRHGRRELAWVKNVVGVGLSYGFIEPLESTGLLTTHENIIKLVDILNRRNGGVSQLEIDAFNFSVENEIHKFRDFVSMHYSLSLRTDTQYWKHISQGMTFYPEKFTQMYSNLVGTMSTNFNWLADFPPALFIAAGMGLRPQSTAEMVISKNIWGASKIEELEIIKNKYLAYRSNLLKTINLLPSHHSFLKNTIYNNF